MSDNQCCRPVEAPDPGNAHRARNLAFMLILGGGLSLIFYTHGASWWYAPLAVLAVVLAHLVVLGGIVAVASRITSKRRRAGADGCCQEDAVHTHDGQSQVIHWPRRYNWLVSIIMLGREGKLRRQMLDLAEMRQGGAVLDVGCGTGTLLLAAAERVGPSGVLHGIDPSGEMVAHAKREAEARQVPIDVVKGSADSLPYSEASIDTVFCTLVLHHLPKPMQAVAIREMRRVLRPGGRVAIVDLQRPKSIARAFTAAMSLITLLHSLGSGTSRFDVLEFEPLLTELGFEDITHHSFGSGAIGALVGRVGRGETVPTNDA